MMFGGEGNECNFFYQSRRAQRPQKNQATSWCNVSVLTYILPRLNEKKLQTVFSTTFFQGHKTFLQWTIIATKEIKHHQKQLKRNQCADHPPSPTDKTQERLSSRPNPVPWASLPYSGGLPGGDSDWVDWEATTATSKTRNWDRPFCPADRPV